MKCTMVARATRAASWRPAPVMPGSTVAKAEAEDAGLFRDYEGERYYFCCDSCAPLWDADLARYANA